MAFLGMRIFAKKWPTPVLKPLAPFFIAGGVVFYGVNSFANMMMLSDEHKNDPRNPLAKKH